MSKDDDYQIRGESAGRRRAAPKLDYRPRRPKSRLPIAMIGCGGVTSSHLNAYRKARYPVIGFTDLDPARAESRREQFFPKARVYSSSSALLAECPASVVDIATHPEQRKQLIRDALAAGKHVLSQKPFVARLADGEKLVQAARKRGLLLAVNQNGRWAPHVRYATLAIESGLLGRVASVDLSVHWDHNWVAGGPFDRIRHLALYDFGIHWFDMMRCFLPRVAPLSVTARIRRSPSQRARPPLLAEAMVDFGESQASLLLRGDTRHGPWDRTVIVGDRGTLVSEGPNLNEQTVTLRTEHGWSRPRLTTQWFDDGFDGAMSELQSAIEDDRRPLHDAEDNLATLQLCFAAMVSADRDGKPVAVSSVRAAPSNML